MPGLLSVRSVMQCSLVCIHKGLFGSIFGLGLWKVRHMAV